MCITGDYSERGIKGQHGYMSEYYVEQQAWITVVPAEISQAGIFLEPLSVVEKAIRQTNKIQERLPWKIQNAIVLGAGTIGLLGAMLLRLEGINTYVLDHSEPGGFKSRLIAQIGACHVYTRTKSLTDVAGVVGLADLVLEATGYAPLVLEAPQLLAMDGVMCLLGVSGDAHQISIDAGEFNNGLVLGNRLMFGSVNANVVDFRAGDKVILLTTDEHQGFDVSACGNVIKQSIQFLQHFRGQDVNLFTPYIQGEKGHSAFFEIELKRPCGFFRHAIFCA